MSIRMTYHSVEISGFFCHSDIQADMSRSKTAILTILEALNFDFLENITLKVVKKFPKIQIQKKGGFDLLKSAKIDFT